MRKEEVINKYKKVVDDCNKQEIDLTNRVNCYVCPSCDHITKTIDIDKGVTPFLHTCEKCRDLGKSSFYHDIAPDKEPTQEWYRPSLKKVLKMHKEQKLLLVLEHILNGGLINRTIIKKDEK